MSSDVISRTLTRRPSPAARAGLKEWDAITAADGQPVRLSAELLRIVRAKKPGELTIRYPAGVIDLTVIAEDGEVDNFAWCVDGMTGHCREGKLTLRGVEPGRRKLVVGATGFGSVLCVIDVPVDGVKKLRVTLRR